jgi:hypothetical protein
MPINNRATPATAQWRTLPIEKWNTTTYHAFLADLNREKYGVDYAPFGMGSVSQRWRTEKGQLKNAQGQYGNKVLRKYIEICFDKHRPNSEYPCLAWGFMFAYMRNELAQAQAEVAREARRAQQEAEVNGGMSADELIDLL